MAEGEIVMLDACDVVRPGELASLSSSDGTAGSDSEVVRVLSADRYVIRYRGLRFYERAWLWLKVRWQRASAEAGIVVERWRQRFG